ncbi:D-2-hydroxyacid dehydrogenase [Aquincola tertiaricarbonis]|uniref:D-2-hydroxyacid dehydrogenase n=1 Tax=Aquincola tertiaricarbonis TaxID=391953 RepID=UPI0018DB952F|nr:D-2-hydroxyacid dehydrogenase [Aquincola tertiaricarbonis]
MISAATRQLLGEPLERLADEHDLHIECAGTPKGSPSCPVDVAYISRDITGLSTKHHVQEPLASFYRRLLASPQLAWVHTHSAGIDRAIYGELMARGVVVTTSAGSNAEVVAQTALAAVVSLSRRLPQLMRAQARHAWEPLASGTAPADLAGQTVVLVGWGHIGRRLHAWLKMLDLEVVVVRHSAQPAGHGIETVQYAQLGFVLPRAQWLVLACPLTPATTRLIDEAAINRLPEGAQLINVARGELIDETALISALRSRRLGGAFLDVFCEEPLPPNSPLWDLPNTVVTPHSAGLAAGNPTRAGRLFMDNLARWLRKEPLVNQASMTVL